MCASPPSMVHSKLFVTTARPIAFLPGSLVFSEMRTNQPLRVGFPIPRRGTSSRPPLFFPARGSLNGLPRTLPVLRRKLRESCKGARCRQMMSAIDADRIAGDVTAAIRHQTDQEIAQFVHLPEPQQRHFV